MRVDPADIIWRHFPEFYPELGPGTVMAVSAIPVKRKLGRFTRHTTVALYKVRYCDSTGETALKTVFVKSKASLSQHEYPRMRRIWEAQISSDKACLLPRPLYATDTCLFTEYLPYPSLLYFFVPRMVRGMWRLHRREMADKVSQVCRWQLDYHSLQTYDWEPLAPYIDAAQSSIERSARFTRSDRGRISTFITSRSWQHVVIPKIDSHADFLLRNMMYDRNRIYVADWESGPYRGNLFLDTNCFIFNLLSVSRSPSCSRAAAKYLGEVYLQEYFASTSFPVDRVLYDFTRVLFQIQYLDDYDRGIHKWTPSRSILNDAYMHFIQNNLLMEVSSGPGTPWTSP